MNTRVPFPDRQWIAYVGPFDFPEGSAAARRVLGIARALAAGGENIVIAAGYSGQQELRQLAESGPDSRIWYRGIEEFNAAWSPVRKMMQLGWLYGTRTVSWLERTGSRPKAVITYGSFGSLLGNLLAFCRRSRITALADIVEWYASSQYTGGAINPLLWQSEYAMRSVLKRYDGIICISSLLEDYYRSDCEVVRVPPTLDVQAVGERSAEVSGARIRLVYAGVPQRKDLLGNAIEALARIDPEGARVELRIVGPTEDVLRRAFPNVPKCVAVLGRKGHDQTMQIVSDADFSILLRPQMRYANAGFPTKVAESMSCGTPVICNLTSDLGRYISDGEHGVVCRDHSADAFAEAIGKVVAYPRERLQRMRLATKARAREVFDYRVYTTPLVDFLARALKSQDKKRAARS